MAKKEEAAKPVLERVYIIPLRRETLKVPNFKKANKAVKTIQNFISKHMKSDDVHIGKYLNLKIWSHGAKNPPHHVKVNAVKDDKGKVVVELADAPKEKPKVEAKEKTVKKELKIEEKLEKQVEAAKEGKAEEAKKIEQEEMKELKKEHHPQHAQKMPAKQRMQEQRPTAPKSV